MIEVYQTLRSNMQITVESLETDQNQAFDLKKLAIAQLNSSTLLASTQNSSL